MADSNYFNMEKRVLLGREKIENTIISPEILIRVTNYGYNETELNNNLTLALECSDLVLKQKNEYSEQFLSTELFNGKFKQVNRKYADIIELARIAFKNDPEAIFNLQLNGRRKRAFLDWYTQATVFYSNLLENPDWTTAMGRYTYTAETITAEKGGVDNLFELYKTKTREKGEAQTATKERDAKVDEFEEWLSDYESVARIALQDQPQLLEKLGIVVRS